MTTIWHNPRCSKSRQTLALLEERGEDVTVRAYLQDPPNADEIRDALTKLQLSPADLMRTGEKTFKALGLAKSDAPDALIDAMASHPILIERPVVFKGPRAALGRPPEAVLDIL